MTNPNVIRLSSLSGNRRSNRNRKPKYQVKPWEYTNEADRLRYYGALVRTNIRRQQRQNGVYDPDKDPFISLLSDKDIYQLQLQAILPMERQDND